MKITVFIYNLHGGGAERVTVNLANYLARKGHKITVLNYVDHDSPYILDEAVEKVSYIDVDKERSVGFFGKNVRKIFRKLSGLKGGYYAYTNAFYRRKLKRFLKADNADLYIVLLSPNIIDLLTLRKSIKAPVIVSERNYPATYGAEIQKRLLSLAPRADGFVFQTEQAKRWYGNSVKNSVIIPNAINEAFLSVEPFAGKRRKAVVSVGRLDPQKNHELLIKAFAASGVEDHVLEIYGKGPLEGRLRKLIDSLGLGERVLLKGFSDDIVHAIKDASLFVLSSDNEGIPNALLEAMALGLPCVTTDFLGGGARTLIDDGENGVIVPIKDENALAEAIRKVLADSALAERLSAGAIKKAESFSPEKIYGEWEEYIKSFI